MAATLKKPTLKQLNDQLIEKPAAIRKAIMQELGFTSEATFYARLNHPERLTPAEQQVFAKHFGKTVEEINWRVKKILAA